MAQAAAPAADRRTQPSPSPAKSYLIVYNAISLLGWASVLGRVATLILTGGVRAVYPGTALLSQVVQSLAFLEIVHSLVGIVRAPVMTTAMQIASRLFILFAVVAMYGPDMLRGRSNGGFRLAAQAVGIEDYGAEWTQLVYSLMLTAWSIADGTRYLYFVFMLSSSNGQAMPGWLLWARYNFFYVLYPVGISGEVWLTVKAVPLAMQWQPIYAYFLVAVLLIYIPGSYILFTHMMAQRRRIMRGKGKVSN